MTILARDAKGGRRPGTMRRTGLAFCVGAAGLPTWVLGPLALLGRSDVPLVPLGLVIVALRVIDAMQQPVLGRLAQARAHQTRELAWAAGAAVAGGSFLLYAWNPLETPLLWFALGLALLAAGRGALAIMLRAADAADASSDMERLARTARREGAMLAGVTAGLVGPTAVVLLRLGLPPFASYGAILGAATLLVVALLPRLRLDGRMAGAARARHLLLVTLLAAPPVAASPALLLTFADERLLAPGASGALLVLQAATAAISIPIWHRAARRWGARLALGAGIGAALLALTAALALGPGDVGWFASCALVLGAAWGAHRLMTQALLMRPALAGAGLDATRAYGAWATAEAGAAALAAVAALVTFGAAGAAGAAGAGGIAGWAIPAMWCAPLLAGLAALWLMRAGSRGC